MLLRKGVMDSMPVGKPTVSSMSSTTVASVLSVTVGAEG